MDLTNSNSLVAPLIAYIAQFYPAPDRHEIEAAAPTLVLHANRLGNEVLLAEQEGLRFSKAVCRGDFSAMERVYFGAQAMLQHRLTPEIQHAVSEMLSRGIEGELDSVRELIFAVASRRDDPDAAMCRFLLWVGVRINLLVATWDSPAIEAIGTLATMEEQAEAVLRELLSLPDVIFQPYLRPLHLLVAEMLLRMAEDVKEKLKLAMGQYGGEMTQIMRSADALANVRILDDRHGVLFNPGAFGGQPGSAQIARRYPIQHVSVSALEKTRSRFFSGRPPAPILTDRLIDVIRQHEGPGR